MANTHTKTLNRGYLFAFEGIDGSGKTTLAKLCVERLLKLGFNAVYLREPSDSVYGRKLRELAVKGRDAVDPMEEFDLFIKDRAIDVKENILPNLDKNAIVIMDRYYHSSIAYQGVRGIDPDFIRTENEKIAPKPDLVFYVSVPVEVSIRRITHQRNDELNLFEKEGYLREVKAMFDQMSSEEIVKIDGARSIEDSANEILSYIQRKICQAV